MQLINMQEPYTFVRWDNGTYSLFNTEADAEDEHSLTARRIHTEFLLNLLAQGFITPAELVDPDNLDRLERILGVHPATLKIMDSFAEIIWSYA
jgi:hypothetical protein